MKPGKRPPKQPPKKGKARRPSARISAKAEYACAAMLELAGTFGAVNPTPINHIATAQDIPNRFLVQILLLLKKVGLVSSVRGAEGGYQLARPPEQITLAQIINAVDDRNIAPPVPGDARNAAMSALLDVWRDVQAQEQRLLEQITLADYRRRADAHNALSYQI